ncbi:substance-P receptor-like [Orbicella faveolata]|uniref:substance-P receptor-like n=1 Tax=Orbicella faveolata TaxID=48498 RepID=UPI0009E29D57|nr:substance-P receptor-like [Orbicella faveolata]
MWENVNTTMNGSQPSTCFNNPTAEKIGKTFFYCSILLVSLAGNTAIGITVYKTKTMRKPINFLILSMAMSDLLYPIFLIPMSIQGLYTDSWLIVGPLGQALCKLVFFLTHASGLVSILSMVLIAVDRFGAVVFPLRSPPISSKLCPFFILTTWIIAMAVFSPYLFARKLVEYPERLECGMHWNEVFAETLSFQNYFVSFSVVFIFIPLVLIAILYIIIFLKLKSRKIPGEQSANTEAGQRRQRKRNVLKMAIAIVLGFAICWLPFVIMCLLVFFASDVLMSCDLRYFNSFVVLMVSANCAINPCICFIFSSNYREGLKNLLR